MLHIDLETVCYLAIITDRDLRNFDGRQSPEARAALRQENAKPIFDDLEEWLRDQLPKISGKSPLAKAIRYALGRMPKTRP